MYRLTLYSLVGLLFLAITLSALDLLPYNPLNVLFSAAYLAALSFLANTLFATLAKTKANPESALISALILSLIIGPLSLSGSSLLQNLLFLSFLAVVAMASKYILAWQKVHIFNPAAFAVFASALVLNQGASWWIGTMYIAPAIIILGLIIARKIQRTRMIAVFLLTYLLLTILLNVQAFVSVPQTLSFAWQLLLSSPILFFAFIMLTEPQTSPKQPKGRILYAFLCATLLAAYQQYLPLPYTFELALLSANIFAFAISRTIRINLTFKEKKEIAPGIFNFWFNRPAFPFSPGQFLEWTLYHSGADSRGIRRYFTIASSPTESDLLLTVKIPEQPSSFKKALLNLKEGERVSATGVGGEFTLPEDKSQKLAFIAGGVGITPFRSMLQHLNDKNESRNIILLYCANNPEEFVFDKLFEQTPNVKTVYAISDTASVPPDWKGEAGLITEAMITRQIPDWEERLFYISGPQPMVQASERILAQLGAKKENIKTDYFPGYEEI